MARALPSSIKEAKGGNPMQDRTADEHLTNEDFGYFIKRGLEGCAWGRLERHLMSCPKCLGRLAAEPPLTPEGVAQARALPGLTRVA